MINLIYFLKRKVIVKAIIVGIFISLITGIIENPPEASIINAKYYGYPYVWRITMINFTEIRFIYLAINIIFWTIFSFITLIIMKKYFLKLVHHICRLALFYYLYL